MPRKKPASSPRSKQPRKKLLLETCEDRILCSATTPTNDAPEAPAALDPATTTAIVATTPEAPQVSSSAVAAGATAAERAEIAAALPADATTSSGTAQLTDEQRAELADVVRESTNEIWFQKNEGQFGEGVLYGFKTGFGSMMVYADHLQLLANQVNTETGEVGVHAVDITFDGANAGWEIVPGGESGVLGSYQNEDGTVLTPGVFKELTIRNVYNGVDLRLYSAESATLEFDWLVARAADYTKIAMNFTGQDGITYAADGAATLDLRFQDLTLKMPEVYQVIDGEKIAVTSAMVAGEQPGQMRYAISGLVDENAPLVIDPNVVWATYFDLDAAAPAFDSYLFSVTANANATYASGWVREIITNANYGPTGAINQYMQVNAGFAQGTLANQIYIYRFSNDGLNITAWTSTGIVSPTGGVSNQKLANMASDLELFPDGRVILGVSSGQIQIYSANLATRSFNATPVTMDMLNSVAVVSNDAFYVGGRVAAAIPVGEIPAANIGPDATFAGALEGVIVRYTNALTTPTAAWATYVGGTSDEYFTGVAMTPDMTKLVFAVTTASNAGLPGLVNAVDSTIAGATEILTGVITDSATKPAAFAVFSYLGGSSTEGNVGGSDTAAAVVTATNTHYFVAGTTSSNDMPNRAGGGQAAIGGGAYDTFAARIPVNGSLGTGFQTTYLGGTGDDRIGGIAYDIRADRLLVFGTTTGSFPTLDTSPPSNYFDSTFGGNTYDIFVATFNGALTTKDFSTYLGGNQNDYLGQTGELVGQGHVFYSDATGLSYLATTVHSTDIPTNVIGTAAGSPPGKDRVKSNGSNDSHIIFAFNINNNDYGDAPASYDNGTQAREGLSNTIRIGAAVDTEATAQNSALATGDDTFTSDDEDGATPTTLAVGQTSYSTTVSVFNNSGAARTLQGWIDFNRDGLFQVGEFASVSVPVNVAQQNVTLTWASLPTLTTGQSFMRLRLSDNTITDNAGTANVDERSVGSGNFGEIEDHGLIISQSSIAGTVYRDLNNNGAQLGAGETGIQTVTVTLTGTNDLGVAVNVSTTTDASGNYTFANIRPSNASGYTITETQPAGFLDGLNTVGTAGGTAGNPPPGDAITGVVIGTNVAATGYLFGELLPSSLSGTVYNDLNNDGLINGSDTTINGVTVTLTGTNDLGAIVPVVVTTSGAGAYSFTNLRPGTYTITETQPAGVLDGRETVGSQASGTINNAIDNNTIATITLGQNVTGTGNNFGELPPASLAATVYRDLNNNGVQLGAGETGIQTVTVTLTGTDDRGNAVNTPLTTDASGNVSYTNLRPGTYTITETQPAGFLDGIDSNGTPAGTLANDLISAIALTAGTAGTGYKFGELPPSSIAGTVYRDLNNNGAINGGETGIQTVTVTLTGTNDLGAAVNVSTTTDASGNYSFTNLRPSNASGYTITETQPAGFLDGLNTAGTAGGTAGNPPPGDAITGIVLASNTTATGYLFGELLPSSLSGTVYRDLNNDGLINGTDTTINGVTLTLTGTNDLGAITPIVVTTAGAGAYSFTNLRPGTYTITETQPAGLLDGRETVGSQASGTVNNTIDNNTIATITLGQNVTGTGNNFGELPPASLAATVYRDLNNDGTQLGAGETGIQTATVTLTGTDDRGAAVNTPLTTDASGNVNFTNLRPGTYTITETQPAGFLDGIDSNGVPAGTLANDVISNIALTVGTAGTGYKFGELPITSLSGTVYRDLNNNGAINGGETGIQTVTVTLTGTDDLGAAVNISTTTDASGNYSFSNLRPSNASGYTITETQPAGFLDGLNTVGTAGGTAGNPPPGDAITGVVLTAGTTATGYNFGELPPSSLAGTVYRDNNNSGAIDAGETGIDGVIVTLTGTNDLGVAVNVSTTTAGGGLYSFANLRPSNASGYTLTETQPAAFLDGKDTAGTAGGSAAAIPGDAISSIVLASNTTGTTYIFGELNPASLSGFVYSDTSNFGVKDAFESGIPGATVTLTGTNDLGAIAPIVATTSATGAYSFTNLRPGTYTITETQPSGYADGADTLGTGLSAPNNAGSAAVSDVFSSIVFSTVITGNNTGANYNFGESPTFGLTKSLQTTNVAATTDPSVTLGEIATFRLVATIPAGSFTNFQLQDALPAGYEFINGSALVSLVSSAGQLTSSTLSGAGLAQTSVGTPTFVMPDTAVSDNSTTNSDTYSSGTDVFFKLGNLTNTDTSGATTESVVIEFQARVVNEVGNQAGTNLDNTFSVIFDKDGGSGTPDPHGPPSNTITSTVAEPNVTISKSANPTNNVDADDVITYTVTLTNPGGANSSTAFDTLLVDTMPSHLLVTGITSTTLNGGATADSAAAIGGGGTSITGQYDIPAGGSVVIVYTATVQTTFPPNGSLTNAAVLTWTSLNGGNSTAPDTNERFGAAGSTFGDGSLNDYRRPTSATTTGAGPTFSKVLFSTSDAGTTGSNVGIGETVTYGLLVTLPEGTTSGFNVLDVLPAGLQYTSSSIVTTAAASNGFLTADFNGTVPAPTVTGGVTDGADVNFAFGAITTTGDNDATSNTFLILVNTVVTDSAGNSGLSGSQTSLPNSATFDGTGIPPTTPPSVTTTVVEPRLQIVKGVDDTSADLGQTLNYTLTITHTASSTETAYDLILRDAIPSGLTLNVGSIAIAGGSIATNTSTTSQLALTIDQLAVGGTITITYTATVGTGAALVGTDLDNNARLFWDTLADDAGSNAVFTGVADGTDDRDFGPTPGYTEAPTPAPDDLAQDTQRITVNGNTITGTVYSDADASGTLNGAETGINNVSLTLSGTTFFGVAYTQTVTTDASGVYSFTNVPRGTYTITETQPAGFIDGIETVGTNFGGTKSDALNSDTITSLAVPVGVNTGSSYNFGELLTSSLAGTTYNDLNNDGLINGSDTTINGVSVTLTGTDIFGQTVNTTAVTSGAGAYSFADLRPGTYTITGAQPTGLLDGKETVGAQASGTVDNTIDNNTISAITLVQNVAGTGNNFGELPPSSLAGSVYGDLDGDGAFDAFESGIPGATVTLTGTDDRGAAVNTTLTTNGAGAYSFTTLRPGTYTITETQPSGYTDGADTIGAPGGTAGNDVFSAITLLSNTNGANNNFGESPIFGLTKSLETTSSAGTSGSNLTLGETATFRLVATIPAGSFTNFQLQDALPAGYQFVNGSALVALVSSAGQLTSSTLSGAGLAQTSVGTPTFAMPDAAVSNNSATNVDTYTSGSDVFFKLGNLTNTDTNGATTESVVIEFQAVVVNEIANQNGTTLDNTFSVLLDKDGAGDPDPHGPPSNTITSTLAEPVLSLNKTATAPGTVSAGDTVNYSVVFTNTGAATAFDSLIADLMPADIRITSITGTTLAGGATADSAAAITGGGTGFSGQFDIPVGGSVTINYVGTVQISAAPGAIETNTATLTWTSINGGNSTSPDANERFGAAGSLLGDGSLNDYRVQSSQTVTVGTATFDKQLFSTGDTNTSGSNVAIAETVTYALVVTVPAGTAPSLSIVDTLPAGLQFVSSSIVTTAAASNGLLTADFNGTVPSPTVTGGASDGDDVTFAFGNIVAAADGNSTNNTFLVLVNTRVTNAVANSGLTPQTTLPNSATFDIPGDGVPPSTPPPVTVTVVEAQLTIDKQFDVSQADAGDTVTISIVVNNTGTGPSYDTLITDVVDTAKFGSITNVTTPAGFTFNNATGTVTYSGGTIAAGGSATFVFTAKLLDAVNATETLSNTASAVGTSQPGVVVGERTTPTVQSTDTLDVPGVLDVTKSIVTPGATVQIGDTITYSVVVRIVEGTTNTLSLVDNLPSNVTYVPGSATISATDAGVTVNGFAANLVADVLTMTATSVVNAGNVDSAATDSDTFTITYQAVVRDIAGNVRGTDIINNLNATAGGGLTDPNNTATTKIIEPELRVVKAVNDATADLGQTLHFTLTVTHTAASDATAYDILVRDALPSGLAGLTGIMVNGVAVGSSPLVDTNNSTGTLLDLKLSQLAVGGTITVEFDAVVGTGSALVGTNIDNNARIYWDSTPAENPNAALTGVADGDEDRDYGATGADEAFNLDTDPAQDTERLTVNSNSISGTVYQDVNANGAFDSGTDAAISGAEVTLTGTTFFGEAITLVATTNASGVYTFNNVPRGTYTLTETQPAGYVDGAETAGTPFGGTVSPALDSNTISTLTVPVGAQSGTDYNFGEVLGSALSGLVYSDANNDGVVDGGETLLDGVTVQITGTDFLGQAVNTTVNTTAGAYSFADLRPGTYTITETTPGGFFDGKETVGTQVSGTIDNTQDSDTISNITLAQNVNGSGNNFGELAPASLGGFVYVDTGNDGVRGVGETPVVGATITLTGTDDRGNLVNTVATSAAGTGAYAFNNLRPGSYTITETQPAGLLDGKETQGTPGGGTVNADEFATIPLTAGTAGADNNFGELRPASLAGFVYTDANNDGIKLGAGETGVGGVTITLTGTDDLGAITPIVLTTAPDGSYNFGNLRPGTYTITETQPASHLDGTDTIGTPGGTTANDVFSNVVITEGVDGTDNNFGELLAATISGNVYRDLNNDGIQLGAGETGIGGATVTLTGTNDLGAIAPIVLTSAPDGTYSFGTLRPGTYTVTETQPAGFLDGTDTAGSPGGGTAGNDVISTITVASGITSANNNFGELPGTSLGGTVYRDFNNDGLITSGETGVGSVNVTLTGTDDLGASVNITIATQPDGTYTFQNLRPGTYSVSEAQPAGLLDGKDTAGTSGGTPGAIGTDSIMLITLPASTSATDYNFGELNPASLSGNVYADLDGDGVFDGFESGIRGATVTLSGTNDLGAITSIVATTDANGAYSFTNLRPGTYTITETQPADYTDGADTLGTGLTAPNSAGTAGNDVMSGITLASVAHGNNTGANYNFGEQPNFTLTKTLVNTSEAGTSGSNVAIGETATFRLVVTIPVGSLTNFQVQDLLPAGYQYVNGSARAGLVGALTSSTITAPLAGVGSTPTFVLADASVSDNALTNSDGYVSGTDVFFKFGDITNTDATAAVEAIVIEFDAVVVNEAANVAGTTLTNSFGILYERNGLPDPDPDPNPNPPPPVTTTVVSPQLTLTKSGTPTSGLEAGDNVTYTLTLTNPGGANASTAFDARILDVLPADLRATAINNVTLNGGATTDSALAITGGGTGLDGQFDIPVGGSVVITYTATVQVSVNPGASETNNAELTWTSINGGNSSSPDAGERYGAPGTIFGDTNLNNLRVTDSETVTVASGTFSKVLFGSSDPGTLGSNVAVGETVIYGLVITLPAGTTQTLNATDALPAGLQFVSSQIVTNAALSNGFLTANFNGTVPSPVVTGGVNDGDDVFFTFSNIVANADGVSGNNTFLLLVSARVTDVAGNSGSPQTTLPNVATFDDPNDPPTPFTPPPVTVDVVEPVLEIAKDFNVAQADAGDTVQISIVVNNTGNGPAYDVVVDDAVNLAKFGSITAVTTPAGFTFNNVAGNVSYTGGTIAAGESATFVFSVKLTDAVNPSEALNNIATATGTSQPGVVVGERTFGPVSDDATLNVPAVFTLTKGITSPAGGTVKIGDLVTYSVNVTLLEGTTNNISLTDLLPAGMTYLNGSAVVSNANGMTVNGFAANAVGNTLSISATSVVNPGNVDNTATADSATFTITYQAVVDDVAGNVSGTLLTNSLTGGGDGTPPSTPPPVTTTVTEPQLQISKLVDDATANLGQTLHFTLTIQNLNVVNGADAYDLLVRDALPAGLSGLANIVVNGATVDANNSTGSLLDLKLSQLALGATATITFDATVDTNTALVGTNIDNNARLYWDSQPGESDNSVLTGTPDSDGDRDYGATVADEVFDATTDPAQDTERVSVNANTISGTIYQDVNENGVFNLGTDTGLGNQTVTLTGNLAAGGAAFTLTTTTDINGNYTFNNVPAGTYVITETQPSGYVDGAETAGTPFGGSVSAALGSNVISSIVVPGGATDGTGYNFGEVLTSTFAGSVYQDVNDDGARGSEPGIGGVTITLTGTDFLGQSITFTTTTNSTGDFNFDGGVNGLRPGTYTITETTQPAGYPDGKDTSGTPSGTVTNDVISNITIAQNTTASGYLFGELFPFDPVKSIVSTSNVGTTGNNVTIGETVRYRLVVALPGGLLNDYVIADNLPSGMSFLDDGTASLAFVSSNGTLISSSTLGTAAGATDPSATPSFTLPATAISNSVNSDVDGWSNGTDVFFRLGNLTNTDDVGRQYVIVEFNAQVLNVSANQQGRVLENTFAPRFDLTGDGTNDPLPANVISNTVRTPVVEPILSLDKKITSGPAQPKPGDTITFTVNIGHASGSGATAWETIFTDTLPAGLQFVSVSTQASGGAVVTKAATFDGSGHVNGLFDIPVGGKITITYQVKVAANVKSGATLVNGADIQWTSAPGDDINERKSGDSLLNKGGLNDYELKAQAQLTVSNPPPPTPFLYFYDRFNKWHRKELDRTLPLGGLYVVESPDNYRPPILPLAPIYSGEADPGSTLVLTLTNANGETIGTQMVVVDAGGNWMATFPTTTIRDFPNSVRIDQINAFYSLSDSPGHNLRAYYSPALSSGHFFFEELRTIAQDTEAPLLSGLAIENPLGEGTTKYGGEMLSTQGVAGGY